VKIRRETDMRRVANAVRTKEQTLAAYHNPQNKFSSPTQETAYRNMMKKRDKQ
jgi:hypothetical protein